MTCPCCVVVYAIPFMVTTLGMEFRQEYTIEIMESHALEVPVITLKATTRNPNPITYRMNTPTSEQFRVDRSSGEVKLTRPLDFEKVTSYTFGVVATDGVHTLPATVKVLVLDVNDNNPVFSKPEYVIDTYRWADTYSEVIAATDRDQGAGVSYQLLNHGQLFSIGTHTGVMRRKASASAFTEDTYTVVVEARDALQIPFRAAVAIVSVKFLPKCNPVTNEKSVTVRFDLKQYRVRVMEDVLVKSAILRIKLIPNVPQAALTFKLKSSTGDNFQVSEKSGMCVIKVKERLDYEAIKEHTLDIEVWQGNQMDSTNVVVTVLNVNDNDPVFSKPLYRMTLHRTMGLLGVVSATDDDDVTSAITYELQNYKEIFFVNHRTGEITLRTGASVTDDEYTVFVQASDNGDPPRTAATVVVVTNTLPPKNTLKFFMEKPFPDEFKLDESGVVRLAKKLDGSRRNQYQLEIGVTNGKQKDSMTLFVNVAHENGDGKLDFPNRIVNVGSASFNSIVAVVSAKIGGKQQGTTHVTFSLNSHTDLFTLRSLNSTSAEIRLSAESSKLKSDIYNLKVEASVRGQSPQTKEALIVIKFTTDGGGDGGGGDGGDGDGAGGGDGKGGGGGNGGKGGDGGGGDGGDGDGGDGGNGGGGDDGDGGNGGEGDNGGGGDGGDGDGGDGGGGYRGGGDGGGDGGGGGGDRGGGGGIDSGNYEFIFPSKIFKVSSVRVNDAVATLSAELTNEQVADVTFSLTSHTDLFSLRAIKPRSCEILLMVDPSKLTSDVYNLKVEASIGGNPSQKKQALVTLQFTKDANKGGGSDGNGGGDGENGDGAESGTDGGEHGGNSINYELTFPHAVFEVSAVKRHDQVAKVCAYTTSEHTVNIRFTLKSYTDLFTLRSFNSSCAEVELSAEPSKLTSMIYNLKVQASVGGKNPQTKDTFVVVQFTNGVGGGDKSDGELVFPSKIFKMQSATLNAMVGIVSAHISGEQRGKTDITFSLKSHKDLFTLRPLNSSSAEIRLTREKSKLTSDIYYLKIEASVEGKTPIAKLFIVKFTKGKPEPKNKDEIEFTKTTFHVSSIEMNAVVAKLSATVNGKPSNAVTYSLKSHTKLFSVDAKSGEIRLQVPKVQLSERTYIVTAHARTSGESANTAQADIKIILETSTVNKIDMLQFTKTEFLITSDRTDVLGSIMATINGNASSAIRYRLISPTKLFSIHPTAGTIRLEVEKTLLTEQMYPLTVEARSGGLRANTEVIIYFREVWSAWFPYGSCTATCDFGFQSARRKCLSPPMKNGSLSCSGLAWRYVACYKNVSCKLIYDRKNLAFLYKNIIDEPKMKLYVLYCFLVMLIPSLFLLGWVTRSIYVKSRDAFIEETGEEFDYHVLRLAQLILETKSDEGLNFDVHDDDLFRQSRQIVSDTLEELRQADPVECAALTNHSTKALFNRRFELRGKPLDEFVHLAQKIIINNYIEHMSFSDSFSSYSSDDSSLMRELLTLATKKKTVENSDTSSLTETSSKTSPLRHHEACR